MNTLMKFISKHKIILIICSIVLFIVAWYVGYRALEAHQTELKKEAIYHDTVDYLSSDDAFRQTYGIPTTIGQYSSECVEYIDKKVCLIKCIVSIDSGATYEVTVHYDFSNGAVFTYQNVMAVDGC